MTAQSQAVRVAERFRAEQAEATAEMLGLEGETAWCLPQLRTDDLPSQALARKLKLDYLTDIVRNCATAGKTSPTLRESSVAECCLSII
jgi:hypothetical protein